MLPVSIAPCVMHPKQVHRLKSQALSAFRRTSLWLSAKTVRNDPAMLRRDRHRCHLRQDLPARIQRSPTKRRRLRAFEHEHGVYIIRRRRPEWGNILLSAVGTGLVMDDTRIRELRFTSLSGSVEPYIWVRLDAHRRLIYFGNRTRGSNCGTRCQMMRCTCV